LQRGNVYSKFQPATNLLITDYPNCGGAEMRSWCHETVANDWQKFRSSENYNKLAYHTEFPWMADGKNGEVSMNYGTRNKKGEWEVLRLYTFKDFKDGMYRRDAVLETDTAVKYQLTDIPLPDGVLRIDKVTVPSPTDVRFGSYSLPSFGCGLQSSVVAVGKKGKANVMGNGDYQIAIEALNGWDNTNMVVAEGLHPLSDKCGVIISSAHVDKSRVFVTLQLWKRGAEMFTESELKQVEKVEIANDNSRVKVTLADGTVKTVTF